MTTGSEEDSEDSEPEDDPDETAVGLEHNEDVGAELADNTENVTHSGTTNPFLICPVDQHCSRDSTLQSPRLSKIKDEKLSRNSACFDFRTRLL
jgi:hypothetical protein